MAFDLVSGLLLDPGVNNRYKTVNSDGDGGGGGCLKQQQLDEMMLLKGGGYTNNDFQIDATLI